MTARIRSLPIVLALVAPLLLAGECSRPAIRIAKPTPDEALTWKPTDVVIDFHQDAVVSTLEVRLNGNDVTSLFAVSGPVGGRMTAGGPSLWDGVVLPGANMLVAEVEVQGVVRSAVRHFTTEGDAFADAVPAHSIGTNGGFNASFLPGIVTGPPVGTGLFEGGLDVVSLGLAGWIELEFADNVIVDGPGVDLTVFENPFLPIGASFLTQPPYTEPGRVGVSQDGSSWLYFPCDLDELQAPYHPGCAGVYPVLSDGTGATPHASLPTTAPPIEDLVFQDALFLPDPAGSGGDSFDLADVGLAWARYIRIEVAPFATPPSGPQTDGFDLDAAAAVNSAPATDTNQNGIPDAVE